MTEREKNSSPDYVRLVSSNEAARTGTVRKGYVPVLVGAANESVEKLFIPIKLINHPSIVSLLDQSVLEFGYNQPGLLRISCDSAYFKEMLKSISRRQ